MGHYDSVVMMMHPSTSSSHLMFVSTANSPSSDATSVHVASIPPSIACSTSSSSSTPCSNSYSTSLSNTETASMQNHSPSHESYIPSNNPTSSSSSSAVPSSTPCSSSPSSSSPHVISTCPTSWTSNSFHSTNINNNNVSYTWSSIQIPSTTIIHSQDDVSTWPPPESSGYLARTYAESVQTPHDITYAGATGFADDAVHTAHGASGISNGAFHQSFTGWLTLTFVSWVKCYLASVVFYFSPFACSFFATCLALPLSYQFGPRDEDEDEEPTITSLDLRVERSGL